MPGTNIIGEMLRGPMGTLSSKRGYLFWMVLLFTVTIIMAFAGVVLPENIQTDLMYLTTAGVAAVFGERAVDKIGKGRPKIIDQTVTNADAVIQQ